MKFQAAETTLKAIRELAAEEIEDQALLDFASDTAEMSETTPVVIAIHPGGRVDYAVFEEQKLRPFDA